MRLRTYFQTPKPQEAYIDLMSDGSLRFESPYDPGLVAALKAQIPYVDRRWDRTQKLWFVASQHAQTLADLAEQYLGERPQVPSVRVSVANTTQLLKLMYLGTAKDRGSGEQTAFGWVNDGWNVIFPLSVLHEWFAVDSRPDEAPTLYAVLGVKRETSQSDLKSAHRRAARQWHPDVCSDPDAREQFVTIQHAYEILSNPQQRKRYDAGLQLAATVGKGDQQVQKSRFGWRSPLRCGYVLAEGQDTLGRFVVSKILQWEDIVDSAGRTLVTSWRFGDDRFQERWV